MPAAKRTYTLVIVSNVMYKARRDQCERNRHRDCDDEDGEDYTKYNKHHIRPALLRERIQFADGELHRKKGAN